MIFQGAGLSVELIESGIAELRFDQPGSSVNTLGTQALSEFANALVAISAQKDLRGLLITSAKNVFIAGADIMEFLTLFALPEAELTQALKNPYAIFNTLEDLPIPTLVAINGAALGGGFELCLACDFRIMADAAQVGLPEIKLGIMPGFGGTVRLPRLIGCDNAVEWIASGKENKAADALAVHAVDAVVPAVQLRDSALVFLRRIVAGEFNYQQRREEKRAPIQLNFIEQMMAFTTAKGLVAAQAGPNMPAPLTAVKAMEKGATLDRDAAFAVESKYFVGLARSPQAQALIGIFINTQAIAKRNQRFAKPEHPVTQIGVLGAGIMGGGIAYQSALSGVPATMRDIAEAGLQAGLTEAKTELVKRVERGRMQANEMADVLARIRPALTLQGFDQLDLVIEAVVENPKVKKAVLAECEKVLAPEAILTSNTSTISITELATALQRPQQFCGMHFFNPVYRMPLVEVIRGEQTSDATVAAVIALAKIFGKTPIVVNDCAGFFVNRVLFPYYAGFNLLIRDGGDFKKIDRVMEKFGWPMGPAFLLDVVGLDTAHHVTEVMSAAYPDRMKFSDKPVTTAMFEHQRFGQKNGRGFYLHSLDAKGKPRKQDDPEVTAIIAECQKTSAEFSDEDIVARLMVPLCLEAVRALEENIVGSAAEADMALVLGIGFPPFLGGALRYIDQMRIGDLKGAAAFCAVADKFATLGKLYEPTTALRAMAAAGKNFYPA